MVAYARRCLGPIRYNFWLYPSYRGFCNTRQCQWTQTCSGAYCSLLACGSMVQRLLVVFWHCCSFWIKFLRSHETDQCKAIQQLYYKVQQLPRSRRRCVWPGHQANCHNTGKCEQSKIPWPLFYHTHTHTHFTLHDHPAVCVVWPTRWQHVHVRRISCRCAICFDKNISYSTDILRVSAPCLKSEHVLLHPLRAFSPWQPS